MKKITMQNIADALDISRVTVWKVFNGQDGVSDTLRLEVLKKAAELGYRKSGSLITPETNIRFPQKGSCVSAFEPGTLPSQEVFLSTVSVVVSRPDSSQFWMNIIHQIAKELAKNGINLMYTYLPSRLQPGYSLPSTLTDGQIQGIIVLNIYDSDMFKLLNALPLPKVFLDMVTDIPDDALTGDLILSEGKNTIYKLTCHLLQRGRKRIGFIGDIQYARTNLERYYGFEKAMTEQGNGLEKVFCLTSSIGIDSYAEEIYDFLSSRKEMPDAFICVSDYVAGFLLQYLYEHSLRIPEDIAVTGFDGIPESPDFSGYLTTVNVDTRALGKRLARQLLYRMSYPSFPYEVIYMHCPIHPGPSTSF